MQKGHLGGLVWQGGIPWTVSGRRQCPGSLSKVTAPLAASRVLDPPDENPSPTQVKGFGAWGLRPDLRDLENWGRIPIILFSKTPPTRLFKLGRGRALGLEPQLCPRPPWGSGPGRDFSAGPQQRLLPFPMSFMLRAMSSTLQRC